MFNKTARIFAFNFEYRAGLDAIINTNLSFQMQINFTIKNEILVGSFILDTYT
jgi:hypothetical protein